jgi:hypothetical protein
MIRPLKTLFWLRFQKGFKKLAVSIILLLINVCGVFFKNTQRFLKFIPKCPFFFLIDSVFFWHILVSLFFSASPQFSLAYGYCYIVTLPLLYPIFQSSLAMCLLILFPLLITRHVFFCPHTVYVNWPSWKTCSCIYYIIFF